MSHRARAPEGDMRGPPQGSVCCAMGHDQTRMSPTGRAFARPVGSCGLRYYESIAANAAGGFVALDFGKQPHRENHEPRGREVFSLKRDIATPTAAATRIPRS